VIAVFIARMAQCHVRQFNKVRIVVQTIRYDKLDKNNDNDIL